MISHRVLARQLKRLGLDEEALPLQQEQWKEFLGRVNQAYVDADQDRYTLERSLSMSSDELLALNEMKDRFFSHVSEELRIPLITILSLLERPEADALIAVQRNVSLLKARIDGLLQFNANAENLAKQIKIDTTLLGKEKQLLHEQSRCEHLTQALKALSVKAAARFEENKPNILYVDHEPDYILYIAQVLSDVGNLRIATDTQTALAQLQTNRIDAIVAAENLRDLPGIGFLKKVRDMPSSRKIPFILLSSSLSDLFRVEALEAGVTDYLCKPFYERELRTRLSRLLQLHGYQTKMEVELNQAAMIQNAVQPATVQQIENIQLDFFSQPAELLSGDCFGWKAIGDWVYLYLGDVAGHGLSSSFASLIFHEALNSFFAEAKEPTLQELLQKVGSRYAAYRIQKDVAFQAIRYNLSSKQLDYVRANAPAALRISVGQPHEVIAPRAMPGLSESYLTPIDISKVKTATLTLASQDYIFIFSDGCYEFADDPRKFGKSEFYFLLDRVGRLDDWKDKVLKELVALNGGSGFPDDLSILRLKIG